MFCTWMKGDFQYEEVLDLQSPEDDCNWEVLAWRR